MGQPSQNMFQRKEALAILRLMSDAYRAGVRDAEWVNSAGRCSEHILTTQEHDVYGRITDSETYGWRRWKHSIMLLNDDRLANIPIVELAQRIKKWSCAEGCLLPLVQDFYNQGLKDWNDNPVSRNVSKVDTMRYPLWTRNGAKNRTFKQMWVDMQTYAYERGKRYEGADSKTSLTPRKFEVFSIAVWQGLNAQAERKHIIKESTGKVGRPSKTHSEEGE